MTRFLTEQILKYLFDFKDIINNAILGYFLKSLLFPQYPINKNVCYWYEIRKGIHKISY